MSINKNKNFGCEEDHKKQTSRMLNVTVLVPGGSNHKYQKQKYNL